MRTLGVAGDEAHRNELHARERSRRVAYLDVDHARLYEILTLELDQIARYAGSLQRALERP